MTSAMMCEDADRALLAETLRRLVDDCHGGHLAAALAEFGFADLVAEDPYTAVTALFDAAGRAGCASCALQDVLLSPLVSVLPGEAAGAGVVLPSIGAHLAGICRGDTVSVRGLVIDSRPGTPMLAPVACPDGVAWVRLEDAHALSTRVVRGLDPALAMIEVSASGLRPVVVMAGEMAGSTWELVLAAGRRALGYQIVGAVARMIDLAVDHARERVQFGRPIGSF